ncbi:MAG TPA: hypothetical protein PLK77_08780 [Pyrinomonadaceae bacterium]|nr:hypothetical protein [Pyrinomonadaceae bacterium]
MKLRIRGNSIRLRLTRSEVEGFGNAGLITETVEFGRGREAFRYQLAVDSNGEAGAKFEGNCLTVIVPSVDAHRWVGSEQVGLEYLQQIGTDESLSILVEKDFACLTERPDEDDSDAFPNPNESC